MLSPLRDEILLRFLFGEDILFVVISNSFFIIIFAFPSGMFHVKWLCLNIHHRAAQKLILLMSLAAWIQSRISKSHLKTKNKIPSLCRSWYYQYTLILSDKKNRSVCFGLKRWHQGLKKKNNSPLC